MLIFAVNSARRLNKHRRKGAVEAARVTLLLLAVSIKFSLALLSSPLIPVNYSPPPVDPEVILLLGPLWKYTIDWLIDWGAIPSARPVFESSFVYETSND